MGEEKKSVQGREAQGEPRLCKVRLYLTNSTQHLNEYRKKKKKGRGGYMTLGQLVYGKTKSKHNMVKQKRS